MRLHKTLSRWPGRRMRLCLAVVIGTASVFVTTGRWLCAEDGSTWVRISLRDSRYFELSDGRPYVPIGLNIVGPPGNDLTGMEAWLKKLASNGGNFVRVWLGSPYFDVEPTRSGRFEAERAKRIDELLEAARKHGIRVKLCIESFRHLGEGTQRWAAKPQHLVANGGPAQNTADYFDGQAGRQHYKAKLAWYAARYGNNPTIFGWELWNEMDAIRAGDWQAWSREMLPELHRLLPNHLGMQSLGSYDHEHKRGSYRTLCELPGNDVLQVHRYLDLGANWQVCHEPVAVFAADAVRDLRTMGIPKPLLLAESGAVEPNHSGPLRLYAKDRAGMILHDVLFAPFFAGAAGPGHIWHWDAYVDRNDLWHHFGRFAAVVRDVDLPAEGFEPFELPHARLHVLGLKGRKTVLIWCRDRENTWRTELAEGAAPGVVESAVVDLGTRAWPTRAERVQVYDPWTDTWGNPTVNGQSVVLPPFTRSIVVQIKRD